MLWHSIKIGLICLMLAGCGFTPLYSQSSSAVNVQASDDMLATKIAPISGHMGQLLRSHLQDLLNPQSISTDKKFRLAVQLNKSIAPVGIEQDRRITRYNVTLIANYTLIDIATRENVDKGYIKLRGSYDSVDSDFATFVAEGDTTERLLEEMARSLQTRLVAAFIRQSQAE